MDIIYETMIMRFIIMIILYKLDINPIYKIVLLLCMDFIDSLYIKYNTNKKWIGCDICKSWRYQFIDKWLDLFGYYLVYLILEETHIIYKLYKNIEEENNIIELLLYTIYYRLIGVIFFSITKKSYYLVIFADLFKEFLIYNIIMRNQPYKEGYLIIFILKIIFEYFWHQNYNKKIYSNSLII